MGRLRWAEEGGGRWELDMEAPVTMEGTARAVPGDLLPLGLSRSRRITRPKQLDFMHRFMASPLVPSFAGDPANGGQGLLLHHAHTFDLTENWSTTILEQLDVQKFSLLFKEFASNHVKEISWPKTIFKHLLDIFSWGLGTEFLFTQSSSFLVEMYNIKKGNRGKAIFQQKASHMYLPILLNFVHHLEIARHGSLLKIIDTVSFRVDSRILFDPKDRYHIARLDESIFAIDWALKVLGSAKATAWYSPKHREAMVELRFFES
ncbi:hypothetical protein GW17_00046254 [Ensete ventricosum]|nr:hypothetical protein GW17_00046254 [Ensete ventricosum]